MLNNLNTKKVLSQKIKQKQVVEQQLEAKLQTFNQLESEFNEMKSSLEKLKQETANNMKRKEDIINCKLSNENRSQVGKQLLIILQDCQKSWKSKEKILEMDKSNFIGDAIIFSALISYSGPFTSEFRKRLYKCWHKILNQNNILCSENLLISRFRK